MLLHKPFSTLAAFVRFDSRMNSFMDILLLVRREALIAERARILKKIGNAERLSKKLGYAPTPQRPPIIKRQLPSFHHSGLAHGRHEYVALRMSFRKQYTETAYLKSECVSENSRYVML